MVSSIPSNIPFTDPLFKEIPHLTAVAFLVNSLSSVIRAGTTYLTSFPLQNIIWLTFACQIAAVTTVAAFSLLAPAFTVSVLAYSLFLPLANAHAKAASFFHSDATIAAMVYEYGKADFPIPPCFAGNQILFLEACKIALNNDDYSSFSRLARSLSRTEEPPATEAASLFKIAITKERFLPLLLENPQMKPFASDLTLLAYGVKNNASLSAMRNLVETAGRIPNHLIDTSTEKTTSQSILEIVLIKAHFFSRTSLLRLFLEHGADPNLGDCSNPLAIAAIGGDADSVGLLLSHGANTRLPVIQRGILEIPYGFRMAVKISGSIPFEVLNRYFTPLIRGILGLSPFTAPPRPLPVFDEKGQSFNVCIACVKKKVSEMTFTDPDLKRVISTLMKTLPTPSNIREIAKSIFPPLPTKKGYLSLVQKAHPDKNPDRRGAATTLTQAINAAYALISDP